MSMENMAKGEGRLTRSRLDFRKELEGYFKFDSFEALVNKAITQEFDRFLAS